jgi:hypothetical protein
MILAVIIPDKPSQVELEMIETLTGKILAIVAYGDDRLRLYLEPVEGGLISRSLYDEPTLFTVSNN